MMVVAQAMSAMVTILLAKFILNDVSHMLGLLEQPHYPPGKSLALRLPSKYEGYYPFDVLKDAFGHSLFTKDEVISALMVDGGFTREQAEDLLNEYMAVSAVYVPYPAG